MVGTRIVGGKVLRTEKIRLFCALYIQCGDKVKSRRGIVSDIYPHFL